MILLRIVVLGLLLMAERQYAHAQEKKAVPASKKSVPASKKVVAPSKSEDSSIDKIFEAQEKESGSNTVLDSEVMKSMSESAKMVEERTLEKKRALEQSRAYASTNGFSSSDSNSGSSKVTGVASIRSETYDNVGRKTEGYFVRCSAGGETRVYRTAWDSNRAWYKPGGINGYYLASGDTSINDVAQNICK